MRYKIAQIKKSNTEIRSVSDSEADCRQFNLMEIQQLLQETDNVRAKNRKSALSKMKGSSMQQNQSLKTATEVK